MIPVVHFHITCFFSSPGLFFNPGVCFLITCRPPNHIISGKKKFISSQSPLCPFHLHAFPSLSSSFTMSQIQVLQPFNPFLLPHVIKYPCPQLLASLSPPCSYAPSPTLVIPLLHPPIIPHVTKLGLLRLIALCSLFHIPPCVTCISFPSVSISA